MTGLARINGEALAVPGLRFWRARNIQGGWPLRVSLICEDGRGAIEVWADTSPDWPKNLGGVEVHSRTPQYDGQESLSGCSVLRGADCYADGSSLAYGVQFAPLIEAGDSAAVLRLAADWHASHFGPAAS